MIDEIVKNLDTTSVIIVVASVIGAVELIKRFANKDWVAACTIVVSAAIGGLMGLMVGVPWYIGLVLGLAASGVVTGLSKASSSSSLYLAASPKATNIKDLSDEIAKDTNGTSGGNKAVSE